MILNDIGPDVCKAEIWLRRYENLCTMVRFAMKQEAN